MATLCALALTFTEDVAIAQVTVAGSYYETHVFDHYCTTSTFCYIKFPQLPTNKFTRIRRVHCSIERSVPLKRAILGLTDQGTDSALKRMMHLQPALTSQTYVYNYSMVNEVDFLYGPGKHASVFIDSNQSGHGFASCTLVGTLSDTLPAD